MKITKEMLKQLIKEAMAARSFEDMEREFEAGEGVVQRAVVRAPDGEEVELERTAAMSDLDWENAKRVAMGGSAKKPVSYAKRLQKKQDTQAAAYRANQKKPASMYAGSKEPQFEQTVRAVVREELEAVLAESDAMKEKAARSVWELFSQDRAGRPEVPHPDGDGAEERLNAKRQKKRLAAGKARDDQDDQ